jgi:hypothetical protein
MLRHDNSEHTTHRITDRTSGASASSFGANHPSRDVARRGGQDDASGSSSFLKKSGTGTVPGPAPAGAGKPGRNGPLGNIGKSVDRFSDEKRSKSDEKLKNYRALRVERFQLQRRSSVILTGWPVATCKWAFQRDASHVGVMKNADGRAFFNGLQSCGSVWVCPVCSGKISEIRRSELNAALAWARDAGHVPVMLTLTHRHGAGDDLRHQLKTLKAAKQRLRQRKEWRKLKPFMVGTITATEVTHGSAGWHTHFHEIIIFRAGRNPDPKKDESRAVAALSKLAPVWVACLRGQGLDGIEKRAFQVQGAAQTGEYMAKWGAAEELALAGKKAGRRAGRTPWQILKMANPQDADCESSALFSEYAYAFRGTRQLLWSPGLKALVGLDEVADADAAETEAEPEMVARVSRPEWNGTPGKVGAKYRRGRVLTAAETDGAAGVARIVADGLDDEGREITHIPTPVEVIEDDDPASWDLPERTAPTAAAARDGSQKQGGTGLKEGPQHEQTRIFSAKNRGPESRDGGRSRIPDEPAGDV